MRKKVVAILFNDGKPVLEIPVASLNSPISLIYYTDEEGNLLHPDLNKAYTDALIKYQGNKNQSDLAVQEVINQFDKSGTDQDIVDLFKVYRFTGNGIFFFDESFNLAKQSPTGIILTGERVSYNRMVVIGLLISLQTCLSQLRILSLGYLKY